jgi:hypothetical protein
MKPESWSETLRQPVDFGMAFSPWNGLAAHQQLGSIMRARRLPSRFRGSEKAMTAANVSIGLGTAHRHLPRIRAPTSIRTILAATRSRASASDCGHVALSKSFKGLPE